MLPFGVGVKPDAPCIDGVICHELTGLLIAPHEGAIYGKQGQPVGAECGDGYVRLGGGRGDGAAYLYAHRVIWETVNGPIPAGLEIDHLSGVKTDNRICNLEAFTKSQNIRRAIALGLAPVGEGKTQAKLTDALVCRIRATVKTTPPANGRGGSGWTRRLSGWRETAGHGGTSSVRAGLSQPRSVGTFAARGGRNDSPSPERQPMPMHGLRRLLRQ
jgi:hypothetical protein